MSQASELLEKYEGIKDLIPKSVKNLLADLFPETMYKLNKGWSSSKFFDKTLRMVEALRSEEYKVEFSRQKLTISKGEKFIYVTVHYQGKSKANASLVDKDGTELFVFQNRTPDSKILKKIKELLG